MNMTQSELARKVKLTQGHMSKIINTINRPSWKRAKMLAAATGTRPELWLEGTSDEIRAAIKPKNRE